MKANRARSAIHEKCISVLLCELRRRLWAKFNDGEMFVLINAHNENILDALELEADNEKSSQDFFYFIPIGVSFHAETSQWGN